ncbi:MAG: hypothetical protein HYT67_00620 [Candidatus Yanofskybacteria bacterium]|nr:hypothetical protein [Candidatus Yanofskybacteria bacterium]
MPIMTTVRQERLLDFIIRKHVKTAKPVGSSLVSKKAGFGLSPATVRNEMAELEKAGYLAQLHTSGGRVPTDKAYRYYVNQLLNKPIKTKLDEKDKERINHTLSATYEDFRAINKAIANILSECSGNLVIAGTAQDAEFFKQGLVSMLKMPEFKEEFSNLFRLASFFEGFDAMFQAIEREFFHTLAGPSGLPIQILIGHENPFKQIRGETIMCTKYILPGDIIGSLTLVGPTRMDYEKNISLINYTINQLQKLNNT